MTFDDLKASVKGYAGLSSPEADTRIGAALNRHYRRITSLIGLDATRFVTRSATTTVGVRTVTFTSIEKIDRVLDTTDSTAIRLLPEISEHQQRTAQPGTGAPQTWALQAAGATSVTILLDTLPQSSYTLQADGRTSLADLSGSDVPAFPESFHDILVWSVLAEELLRKEKDKLAAQYDAKAAQLLADLRFYLADTHTRDLRQGSQAAEPWPSGGSGGGTVGGTAYTQTALLTFDLGSGVAPFAVAQSNAPVVTNLDADKLDGQHGTYYLAAENLTGTVPLSSLANITNAEIAAAAAIAWTKISKTGSSLADLTTKSAADLTSGTLPDGRFPATLPAASGANLTALNASNLASGTVGEARLGSGTGSVHKVLRGNNTWGDHPGVTTDGASRIQQVAFAATQSASSDANTLDDYEEGSWTPTDASGAALSFSTVEGSYVKVGQLVTCAATFTFPVTADTSTVTIGGLPFTVQNSTNDLWLGIVYGDSSVPSAAVTVKNTLTFTVRGLGTTNVVQNADFSANAVRVTLTYRATA